MTTAQTRAHDHFSEDTAKYQQARQELEAATGQLQRLGQQRAATLQSAHEAGERWRQEFRDAAGEPTKAIRKLKHEELTLRDEVEQLDELLAELEPHVAELKQRAATLRAAHVESLHAARHAVASNELGEALDAVFDTPAGQQLLTALGRRSAVAQREVLKDNVWLGRLGFDGHESSKPGFMATISHDDRRAIAEEVDKRRRALIADAVMERMGQLDAAATRFEDDLSAPLPALACEQ